MNIENVNVSSSLDYPLIRAMLRGHQWAILEEYGRAFYDVLGGQPMRTSASEPPATLKTGYLFVEEKRKKLAAQGVALIPVMGPLMPLSHATMCGYVRGSDAIAQDFRVAVEDPSIKSIILYVSSPGGAVEGTSELSDAIYHARGTKKITAFVSGLGASAAYWIASAADEIVVSKNAQVGSVGVLLISDPPEPGSSEPVVIKSKISPKKHMDIASEEGTEAFQNLADQIAEVMVADIARNRGTDPDTVVKTYGEGFVRHGKDAVRAKMAERTATFDAVVKEHLKQTKGAAMSKEQTAEGQEVAFSAADIAAAEARGREAGVKQGAEQERERIRGIAGLTIPVGFQHLSSLVESNLFNPEATAESVSKQMVDAIGAAHDNDAKGLASAAEAASRGVPVSEDEAGKEKRKKFLSSFQRGAGKVSTPHIPREGR